jgi:hypothetical protein
MEEQGKALSALKAVTIVAIALSLVASAVWLFVHRAGVFV